MRINAIIFVLLLVLWGCKEEFLLKFDTNDEVLVVEGGVTNNPGPYLVRLSTTLPVNQPLRVPFENCEVQISDQAGNQETLTEIEPGVYATSENGIQGEIGNAYSLRVVTPDAREYETVYEEMKELVDIDSVYAELEVRENLDYPFGLPGYQFYIDTKPGKDDSNYFLWKLTETYQYESDYTLYALYYYGDMFYTKSDMDQIVDIVHLNYDTLYTCWNSEAVQVVYTGQTANLTVPFVTRQPLHFVTTETKKLSIKYSLLVQQYSLSEKAYKFWRSIQDQISDESFLNTRQPYNITGNLKNVNDDAELTYGFFTVASVTQKRVFYAKPNATFYYDLGYTAEPVELHKKKQPVYLVLKDNAMYYVHPDCVDCRTEGGTITKPDFWVD